MFGKLLFEAEILRTYQTVPLEETFFFFLVLVCFSFFFLWEASVGE